jgi:mono/diheme cytochrome c family protein
MSAPPPRFVLLALFVATTLPASLANAEPSGSGPFSWTAGPITSGAPVRPRPAETASLRESGGRVYQQRCAACHGKRGDGHGWAARGLRIPPRDFTSGVYKLRTTMTGSIPTDEDLFATISRGMHGTPMMSWRGLPEDERWALVGRLKSFSVRFSQEQPAAGVDVPEEARSEEQLAAEGAGLWKTARCGACHGTGNGRGPSVALLEKDPGRQVRVRDLSRGEFLRGTSARDIYLTLRTGMDGTPMGSYADGLSPGQTWALAAYVRTLIKPSTDK